MRSFSFSQALNAAVNKKQAELQARAQAAEPGVFDFWIKMNDESAKLADRLQASRLIINQSHLLLERRVFEARLAEVEDERRQEENEQGKK